MDHTLFQQDPSSFIPILLISLAVTVLVYGTFPFIFAQARVVPITKKTYNVWCYGINFSVLVLFLILDGEAISGGAYILWTSVFSFIGIKILRKRGVLIEGYCTDDPNHAMECESCGYRDETIFYVCPMCGKRKIRHIYLNRDATQTTPPATEGVKPPATADTGTSALVCRQCGNTLLPDTVFCERCGTKVDGVAVAEKQTPVADEAVSEHSPEKKKRIGWVAVVAVLALVLTAAAVGVAVGLNIGEREPLTADEDAATYPKSQKGAYATQAVTTQTNARTTRTTQTTVPPYFCMDDACLETVSASGRYCREHACETMWCDRPRQGMYRYCSTHKCGNGACGEACVENGEFCELHTCAKGGCVDRSRSGYRYCFLHSCMWTGCNNGAEETEEYCYEHVCMKPGCVLMRGEDSDYCFEHRCFEAYCKNAKTDSGEYCYEHTCIESGCTAPKMSDSDFCFSHCCLNSVCKRGRYDNSLYCSEHECRNPDCVLEREAGSYYCVFHE